jgi:hypothetical protein
MKIIYMIVGLAFLALCCGCNAETPTPLSTEISVPTAVSISSLSADSLLNLSGDTFLTSTPFRLDKPSKIEITWEYLGKGPLAIWLVNNNEFSGKPDYDRILIKDVDDLQTSGQSEIELIAGEFVVEVEIADGPWKITVQSKP